MLHRFERPNSHLVSRALLKLLSYVTIQANRASERKTLLCRTEFCGDLALPSDVLKHFMQFLDPISLTLLGNASHALYSHAQSPFYWRMHNSDLIIELGLDITSFTKNTIQSRNSFVWIYQQMNTILDLMVHFEILKGKKIDEEETKIRKNLVECIFEKKLGISSPWIQTLKERIERELISLPSDIHVIRLDNYSLHIKFQIKSGFYKGENLAFEIFFGEEYPQRRPIVRSLIDVYHPYFQENNVFHLPKRANGNEEVLTVIELIQELQIAFLDSKILTNSCSF